MARRIAVTLDLDAKKYITTAAQVEATTKAVDEEMKGLDKQVKETERDLAGIGVTAAVAKREIGGVGDNAERSSMQVKGLDDRIKAAKLSVGQLAVEFAKTGDLATQKDLNSAKRALATLEKTRRDILTFAASDTAARAAQLAAAGVTDTVGKAITSGVQDAQGLLMPAVIGLGVALAPALGAAISGIVVGAVGLGGIAGGIASAAKDPRVKNAAQYFMASIKEDFFAGGTAFVGPIEQGLNILAKDFHDLDLADTFAKAAPSVSILASGIGDFVKNLMPGFNNVLGRSTDITHALADGLDETGTSLSTFMTQLISSPGTIEGLRDSFHALSVTITAVGGTLHFLGDLYDLSKKFSDITGPTGGIFATILGPPGEAAHFATDLLGKALKGLQDQYDKLSTSGDHFAIVTAQDQRNAEALTQTSFNLAKGMDNVGVAANEQRRAMEALAKSIDDMQQLDEDLLSSELDVAQGMLDMKKALAEGKKGFDDSTQAGVDNQRMILDQIKKLQQERDAQLAASDGTKSSVEAIKAAYNDQIDALKKVAIQMGATKKQADLLAGTYEINVVATVTGVGSLSRISDTLHQHGGGAAGYATGTDYAPANVSYLAGERGPELITAPFPTAVHTASQTRAWMGGGGSQNLTMTIHFAAGADSKVTRALAENMRVEVRTQAGGSVQTYLGPRGRS